MMRTWTIITLVALATPALAADQFDLVCTPTKGGREVVRYRIDLAKGEWCSDSCMRTFKIVGVTSGEIVLEDKRPALGDSEDSRVRINRTTGQWTEYRKFSFEPAPITKAGICEPAAFTGFPATKF